MSLEAAIRSELLASEAVSTIVDDRVFLGRMPTEFPLPAITTSLIWEQALQVNQGITNAREATYRLDLWAADYGTVRRLLEACRSVLVAKAFRRHGVRVGTVTEDNVLFLEPSDASEIWHGVLELNTPYRYEV